MGLSKGMLGASTMAQRGVSLRPPTFGHPKYRERQVDFNMFVVSIPG